MARDHDLIQLHIQVLSAAFAGALTVLAWLQQSVLLSCIIFFNSHALMFVSCGQLAQWEA
jgi:hypothetical protein